MRKSIKSEFIRKQLPYGIWRCADGREVLFAREYAPICERYPGQPPKMTSPTEIIPWKHQEWFYRDATPPAEKLRIAEAKLAEWDMVAPVVARVEEAIRKKVEAERRW
jgi:hypothetical protein